MSYTSTRSRWNNWINTMPKVFKSGYTKVETRTPINAGDKYGDLTIIMRVHDKNTKTANLKVQVRVECKCGNRLTIPFWYLVRPHSPPKTNCGKCGPKSLRTIEEYTHRSWYSMNYRCETPTFKFYPHYGGRGIKVCDRWSWNREDGMGFENFIQDMGSRPEGLTIDRINNMGHYQPSNCKWSTAQEQRMNQGRDGPLAPIDDLFEHGAILGRDDGPPPFQPE